MHAILFVCRRICFQRVGREEQAGHLAEVSGFGMSRPKFGRQTISIQPSAFSDQPPMKEGILTDTWHLTPDTYSYLSAAMGSILVARRAGR